MLEEYELKLDIARYRENIPVVYSVVIPVYNEVESLEVLLAEMLGVMTGLKERYEVIFVNDGSDDGSRRLLKEFVQRLPEIVRIVDLKDRAGQTNALKKGIHGSKGEIIITLDADLQNDPTDIAKLIGAMNERGSDCVCGWRRNRHDKWLKAALSKTGNFLQRLFTGLSIHDISCTLRACKRSCGMKIPLNWEGQHRFIPLCLSLQGFKITEIETNHRDRRFGQSKYGHKRIFKVMIDFFKILQTKGKK